MCCEVLEFGSPPRPDIVFHHSDMFCPHHKLLSYVENVEITDTKIMINIEKSDISTGR